MKNFSKAILWIGNSFFWALGLGVVLILLEATREFLVEIENKILAFLILVLIGGFVMYIYNILVNPEDNPWSDDAGYVGAVAIIFIIVGGLSFFIY